MRTVRIIACVIFFFAVAPQAAQSAGFVETHRMFLQFGVGYDLHGRFDQVQVPPIHATFDYAVRVAPKAPLTFGMVFAYARSERGGSPSAHADFFAIGFRCAYHFTDFVTVPRLDLYAGAVIGGVAVNSYGGRWLVVHKRFVIARDTHRDDGYFLAGVFGGVRYFVTEHFGFFSELGYGISYICGGICFTF